MEQVPTRAGIDIRPRLYHGMNVVINVVSFEER